MKVKIKRSCNWTDVEVVLDTEDENYGNDLRELETLFNYFSDKTYGEEEKPLKQAKTGLKKPVRMATDKQIDLLYKYNLIYEGESENEITYDEAYRRISDNMNK